MTDGRSSRRHLLRQSVAAAGVVVLSVLVFLALFVSPPTAGQAHAQACCSASDGGQFGAVNIGHEAMLTASASLEPTLGSYGADGQYRSYDGATLYDLVTTVGGGTRFGFERFQIHGAIPLRLQYRDIADSTATGWGIGDASVGLRFMVVRGSLTGIERGDPTSYVPFLEPYLTGKIPVGRTPDSGNDPSGADITGDGHWGLAGGVRAMKFLHARHAVGPYAELDYRFGRHIERATDTVRYRPGTQFGVGLTYLHTPSVRWSWGLDLGFDVAGDAREAGEVVADSATRRLSGGVHVTRHLAFPFWEVTLSATNDAWGDHAGKNLPFVGPSIALSVQRNFM